MTVYGISAWIEHKRMMESLSYHSFENGLCCRKGRQLGKRLRNRDNGSLRYRLDRCYQLAIRLCQSHSLLSSVKVSRKRGTRSDTYNILNQGRSGRGRAILSYWHNSSKSFWRDCCDLFAFRVRQCGGLEYGQHEIRRLQHDYNDLHDIEPM